MTTDAQMSSILQVRPGSFTSTSPLAKPAVSLLLIDSRSSSRCVSTSLSRKRLITTLPSTIKRPYIQPSKSSYMSSSVPIPPATPLPHLTRTRIVPGRLKVTELFFNVPLDYANPNDGRKLRLFCRATERHETPILDAGKGEPKPWLVYLPGGPGFGANAPQDMGITGMVLDRGYQNQQIVIGFEADDVQLLCFDHRGMGLSTPVTAASIIAQGNVTAQAAYLKHFRADNAVRDLEAIRQCLTEGYPTNRRKWSLWGQSYGGFVTLTYLSFHPDGLREVFTTGGSAPITQRGPDEVYKRLYKKGVERNRKYYEKYPEDRQRVNTINNFLNRGKGQEIRLPAGGLLTQQRFKSIGISFGAHGGFDSVHGIVLRMANDLEIFGYLSRPTLSRLEDWSAFDNQVIYAVLHEPLYCQGTAPQWSAEKNVNNPDLLIDPQDRSIFFTGEMVFRGDFESHPELGQLTPVAEVLAATDEWPDLYDLDQLKKNEVSVYAATYMDDMYVDFDFAQETAALVKNYKTFVTNLMYHDAVRSKTEEVARALFALRDDSID